MSAAFVIVKRKLEVAFRLKYSGRRLYPLVMRYWKRRGLKEKAMRKVLILVLLSLFFAAACSKSEETPAAPEASGRRQILQALRRQRVRPMPRRLPAQLRKQLISDRPCAPA